MVADPPRVLSDRFAWFPVSNLSDVNLDELNEYRAKIYPKTDPSELKAFDASQFNNGHLRGHLEIRNGLELTTMYKNGSYVGRSIAPGTRTLILILQL